MCQTLAGLDPSATRDLHALVDLLDKVAPTPGVVTRLKQVDPPSKVRASWVRFRFEEIEGVRGSLVDEDLAPLNLLYSSDVLENRFILGDQAVEMARSNESVPGGQVVPSGGF